MAGVRRSAVVILATIFATCLPLSQSFAFAPVSSSRSVIHSQNGRQLTRVQFQSSTREPCEARQLSMKRKRRGKTGGSSVAQLMKTVNDSLPDVQRDEKKIMISKLDDSLTEEDVKEFGATAGSVVSIKYFSRKNSHTKAKGFAFVEYEDAETAAHAVHQLRHIPLHGSSVNVEPAYEDEKEIRAKVRAHEKANPGRIAEIKAMLKLPLDLEKLDSLAAASA